MARELHCVIEGCDESINEDTAEEVLEAAEEYAAEAHPALELDEKTVETISDNTEAV